MLNLFRFSALIFFGLGKSNDKVYFNRSWPPKALTPDFKVSIKDNKLIIAFGSGLLCDAWCVSFKTKVEIDNYYHGYTVEFKHPKYTLCNIMILNF